MSKHPENLNFDNTRICHKCGNRVPDKLIDCPRCLGIPDPTVKLERPKARPRAEVAAERQRHAEQNPELPMDGEIRVK